MGQPILGNTKIPERVQTRGTETSKYPEEKKSIEIFKVVASEMKTAKTACTYSLQALFMRSSGTLPDVFAETSESYKSLI